MEVCPDTKFQNFVRREFTVLRGCLARKISWAMLSVVLAGVGVLSGLVYTAYSRGQDEKEDCIKKNSTQVQELKTNMKVMQVQFEYVSGSLEKITKEGKEQFFLIMKKLKEIENGQKSEGD